MYYYVSGIKKGDFMGKIEYIYLREIWDRQNGFQTEQKYGEIEIPSETTCIDKSLFWGNPYLIYIEIPDHITEIGESSFFTCSSLL